MAEDGLGVFAPNRQDISSLSGISVIQRMCPTPLLDCDGCTRYSAGV